MALSNAQKAQVMTWLENRTRVTNCPMCAAIAWEVTDLLQDFSDSDEDMTGERRETAHPMVQSVCAKCGYVLLLSAHVLGLIPKN